MATFGAIFLLILLLLGGACGFVAVNDNAVTLAPNPTVVALQREAELYLVTPNPFRAQALLDEAAQIDQGNPRTLVLYAESYLYTGSYQAALDAATRAIEIDPAYGPAYLWRAQAYVRLEDPDSALADYTQLVALDAEGNVFSFTLFSIANLYIDQSRYQDALDALDLVADEMPTNPALLQNRAEALIGLGRYADAEADIRRAMAERFRGGNHYDWLLLGHALAGQGRDDEARDAYRQHIDTARDNRRTVDPAALDFVGEED